MLARSRALADSLANIDQNNADLSPPETPANNYPSSFVHTTNTNTQTSPLTMAEYGGDGTYYSPIAHRQSNRGFSGLPNSPSPIFRREDFSFEYTGMDISSRAGHRYAHDESMSKASTLSPMAVAGLSRDGGEDNMDLPSKALFNSNQFGKCFMALLISS